MKIVAISDLHGSLDFVVPEGDIFTISGDICPVTNHDVRYQQKWVKKTFIPWLKAKIDKGIIKDCVWVSGNHDWMFQDMMYDGTEDQFRSQLPKHIHYLRDTMVDINGLKIYGTPWSAEFCGWAFMKTELGLENVYKNIPENADIVLSHGPAYEHNDAVRFEPYEPLGSKALLARIEKTTNQLLFQGHIHSGLHDVTFINRKNNVNACKCYNVSLLDESYNIAYEPLEIEI